jgi:signal transduction histidine kinase
MRHDELRHTVGIPASATAPLVAPSLGLRSLIQDDASIPKRVAAFRAQATRFLLWEEWLTLLPTLLVGHFAHVSVLPIILIGSGFAGLSSYSYRANPISLATRYSLAIGLLVNVLLLIYALSSFGSWQLDGGHMWIFAVWSHCLALLCWRSLAVSGFFGVLHHFIMIYLVPAYVFPDGANFGRVLLHGGVVIMQMSALSVFIFIIFRMLWLAENLELSLQRNARQLVEISATKSKFLAMMSHELRTPLNAIIGFSEVMKEEIFGPQPNAQYHDYVAGIHDSGNHLLAIINDILDLSKVEAGKLDLAPRQVSAVDLTQDCMTLVAGVARANGVKLLPPVFNDVATISADPRLMKQMLINLLTNACKYTAASGEVQVRWHKTANGIAVAVADTGIGMTAEEVSVALKPFGQVHNPLVRGQEGTGLGLPLVKSLIEAHGGQLQIESKPQCGSVFTLSLPQASVAVPSLEPTALVHPILSLGARAGEAT